MVMPNSDLLGQFAFVYRSLAVQGFGISASSNFAVVNCAAEIFLKKGAAFTREAVAARALAYERRQADGSCIGAQDVYPIVWGGAVEVHTTLLDSPPAASGGAASAAGAAAVGNGVAVREILHDPAWIADHVVLAFNKVGERHDVPNLLDSLFKHPHAKHHVAQISLLAKAAADAITKRDIRVLAACVKAYRRRFHKWTGAKYINGTVREVVAALKKQVGKNDILAYKSPGAGAAEAIVVLVPDREVRNKVLKFFQGLTDWWSSPAFITTGLCAETITSDGHVRFTAGHRIDFVGGADLGQSPYIDQDGVCCSIAVEPRSELVMTGFGRPRC